MPTTYPGINKEDSDSLDRLNRAGIEINDFQTDPATGRLLLPDYARQYLDQNRPPLDLPIAPIGRPKPTGPNEAGYITDLSGLKMLDYKMAPPPAAPPGDESAWESAKRGFNRTWPETLALGGGLAAYLGDVVGSETVKQWGLQYYKKKEEEAQKYIQANDSFSDMWDSEKGSFKNWLANSAGYVTGQALQSVAAAIAGGAVGTVVAPGAGTVGGTLLGAFETTAAKQALKKGVEQVMEIEAKKMLAQGAGLEAARVAAQKAGSQFANEATKRQAAAMGATLAMGGYNVTQEIGSIYPEAVDEKLKATGKADLDAGDLWRVGTSGLAAATIETLADKFNLNKLMQGSAGKTVLRRAAVEVPLGMAREGGTEAAQTVLERYGAGQEVFGKEGIKDIVDSAAVGAVGGGLFGGMSSLHRQKKTASQVDMSPVRSLDEILTDIEEAPVAGASISYPGGMDFAQPDIPAMKAENMSLAPQPTPVGNEVDIQPFLRENAAAKAQAAEAAINQEKARQAEEAAKIPYVREDLPNVTSGVRDNLALADTGPVGNEIDIKPFLAERAQDRAVQEQPVASTIPEKPPALPSPNSPASTGAMVNGRPQTFAEVQQAERDRAKATEMGTTPTRVPSGAVPQSTAQTGLGRGPSLGVPFHTVQPERYQGSKDALSHLPAWTKLHGLEEGAKGEAVVAANGRSAKSRITTMAHALDIETKGRELPEIAKDVNDKTLAVDRYYNTTADQALKNPEGVKAAAKIFGVQAKGVDATARAVIAAAKAAHIKFYETATRDAHKKAVLRAITKDEYVPLDVLRRYPDMEKRFGRRALKKAREAGENVTAEQEAAINAADTGEANAGTAAPPEQGTVPEQSPPVDGRKAGAAPVQAAPVTPQPVTQGRARPKYEPGEGDVPIPPPKTKSDVPHETTDRRISNRQRKEVDQMTPEEMKAEIEQLRQTNGDLLINPVSGLPGRAAFNEASKDKAISFFAAIDMDGLKYINDTFGHEAGDEYLAGLGMALKDAGLEAYHIGGDEFAVIHFGERADLADKLVAIEHEMQQVSFEFTGKDTGKKYLKNGAEFSFAIGKEYKDADKRVAAVKESRTKSGKRAERGQPPRGLVEQAAGADVGGESTLATEFAGEGGRSTEKKSGVVNIRAKMSLPSGVRADNDFWVPSGAEAQMLQDAADTLAAQGWNSKWIEGVRNLYMHNDVIRGSETAKGRFQSMTADGSKIVRSVTLRGDVTNPVQAAHILAHEAAHASDFNDEHKTFASMNSPRFRVEVNERGAFEFVGDIMQEVTSAFLNEGSSEELFQFLWYPFGRRSGTAMFYQTETFAQLSSMYYTARSMMQRELPLSYKMMEHIHEQITEGGFGVHEAIQRALGVRDFVRPGSDEKVVGIFEDRTERPDTTREGRGRSARGIEPNLIFEVAPDPNNTELSARWNSLSHEKRRQISEGIANALVPDFLKSMGVVGRIDRRVGSYLNDTNTAFSVALQAGNPVFVAKALGYGLSQDSMMVVSTEPFKGGEDVGVIAVNIGESSTEQVEKVYNQLREIEVNGEQPVGGQTYANGTMMILNYSNVPTAELADLIEKKLGNKYEVEHRTAYAAFPTKEEYGYGQGNEQGAVGTTAGGEGVSGSRQATDLRTKATAEIEAALAREVTTPTGKPKPDGFLRERAAASNVSEYREVPPKQTQTPQFKSWFGNSKIVNDDGSPKRMYHGSTYDIEAFKRGSGDAIFFTPSPDATKEFAPSTEGSVLYPAYLKVENPFDYNNREDVKRIVAKIFSDNASKVIKEPGIEPSLRLHRIYHDGSVAGEDNPHSVYTAGELRQMVLVGDWRMMETAEFIDAIKEEGYDGFYTSEFGERNVAVFNPEQIKSAVGNNGDFDATNPNITQYNPTGDDVVEDFMRALSGEIGWQEVGGRLIRDTDGNPVARTRWIPHSDFWPGYRSMGGTLTEAQARTVIQRALAGERLSPREEALVKYAESYAIRTLHDNTDAHFYRASEDFTKDDLLEGITSFYDDGIPNPHDAGRGFNNLNNNTKSTLGAVKDFANDNAKDALPMALQFLGRRQIADIYGKLLPQLNDYNKEVQLMDAEKSGSAHDADKIVQRWAKLPTATADALADLMHDATLAQYDPDNIKNTNLGKMKTEEQKANAAKIRQRWVNLPDEAKQIYRDARDMYKKQWADVEQAIIERIQRAVVQEKERKQLIDEMKLKFEQQLQGVYFPLARFGDYFITVKKPGEEGNVAVVFAESTAEAKKMREQLVQEYAGTDNIVSPIQAKAKFNASQSGPNKEFIGRLFSMIENQRTNDEISNVAADSLIDSINQLYLTNLPDLSWAKHALHRKGIAGYSRDARRAFAQNIFHGGFHLARINHADILQDQIDAMRSHIADNRNDPRFDAVKAQRVLDEMVMRHQKMLQTDNNPIANFLTGLGFLWHMGMSPASAMVNLSQTALIAYPMMAAKFGLAKAGGALIRASKEAATNLNDMSKTLQGDEKAAYDKATREGIIDLTMAHDLAGVSQGKDNQLNRAWSPVMKAASWMFHQTELFNRQATFMAAYRLAKEGGETSEQAYDTAAKVTFDSHFDYSASNRPRVMTGPVQRVLFLFKQYGQNMAYTLARNAYQALQGATPEERKVALKTLSGMMVMTGLTAGAFGLPWAVSGAWFAAASALGSDKDDPWDAKVALRNYLADAVGPDMAEMMVHGVTRKLFPGDISARIGLDTLFFGDGGPALEGAQWYNSMAENLLGPVAGIGLNVTKGAADVAQGEVLRGIAGMMPVSIANPLKALRYAQEGVKDKTGVQILDELTFPELAIQSTGFSPNRVKEAYEGRSAVYQVDKAVMNRRKELLRDFAKASINGDSTDDIMKEILAFDEKQPQAKIDSNALRSAIKDRIMRVEQADNGVYLPKKRRSEAELADFANTAD